MTSDADIGSIFSLVIDLFKNEMTHSSVNLWFGEMRLSHLDDRFAVLVGKSEFKCDIARKRYRTLLEDKFAEVLGFPVTVYIFSEEKGGVPDNYEQLSPETNAPDIIKEEPESGSRTDGSDPLYYSTVPGNKAPLTTNFYNKAYTFDNFIVGNSNKFAHAASIAVAENPATAYNPLFIYGPSGLGKTHLLYAITNEIISKHPEMNIVYVKSEELINQLIEAFAKKETAAFREKYRSADVLLVDDIQFIAGKVTLQEEFFHTFNTLHDANKQIILTSDRPPRDIKTLEDRLRTRFEWGLIVDVQPPDFELRIAILKAKAAGSGFEVPNDVLTYLADKLQDNIRQIEGVIKKMGAKSFLSGVPITIDTAREAIAELVSGTEPVHITIDKILSVVSNQYGISIEDIKGRGRQKDKARARHISIYLVKAMTDIPLSNIAKFFDDRDHTTIMSSIDVIEKEIRENPSTELEINELKKELR